MKILISFFLCLGITTALSAKCCQVLENLRIGGIVYNDMTCSGSTYCSAEQEVIYRIASATMAEDKLQLISSLDSFCQSGFEVECSSPTVSYVYATAVETFGELRLASQLFKNVRDNVRSNQQLKRLATIGEAGCRRNVQSLNDVRYDLETWLGSRSVSANNKAELLIKYIDYVQQESQTALILSYLDLVDEICDDWLKAEFLMRVLTAANRAHLDTGDYWMDECKKHLTPELIKLLGAKWQTAVVNYLIYKKRYEAANLYAGDVLAQSLQVKSIDSVDLSLIVSEIESDETEKLLAIYARSRLYLTRVGKGLAPVQESYQIYRELVKSELCARIKRNTGLVTQSRRSYFDPDNHNQLIIGGYLYKKTGDKRYLSESMSLLDASISAGLNYWITKRKTHAEDEFPKATKLLSTPDSVSTAMSINNKLLHKVRDSKQQVNCETSVGETLINLDSSPNGLFSDTSASLAFYQTDGILYRLFVSKDTVTLLDRIISVDGIHKQISIPLEELAALIQDPTRDQQLAATSYELYELLFQGLDTLLPTNLHIVANGELESLPFSLLRKDSLTSQPRYLGIEHAISRQFSFRTMQLLNELDPHPPIDQPLAFAPHFTGAHAAGSSDNEAPLRLQPLRYNTAELRHLEKLSGGEFLYGEDASLSAFHEQAADYAILHFATHAVSNQRDGLLSRIYLVDEHGQPAPLDARRIGDRTLKAKLVTLSACETGRGGQNTVEGTVGLTRAFLAAGARTVVASNWAVEDRTTLEVMASFYDNLAAGAPPHQALHQARITYLERHPAAHPSHWAAFEAYGGMHSISWDQSHSAYTKLRTWIKDLDASFMLPIATLLATVVLWYRYASSAASPNQ